MRTGQTFAFEIPEAFFHDEWMSTAWKDFDSLLGAFGTFKESSFPPYNIYTLEDGSAKIEFALAGYDENEISLKVEDGKLTLSSEVAKSKEDDNCNCVCVHRGIRAAKFRTSIPLAAKFDLSNAEASFKNGMLTVMIPLAEERKPKAIKISK